MILAIDPGLTESGYVLMDEFNPIKFGKILNHKLRGNIASLPFSQMVIEKPVCSQWSGSEVSDTAIACGMFAGAAGQQATYLITRSKVKGFLLGKVRGKTADSLIITYLNGRFAPDTPNRGKGSKSEPGFFYGFAADVWQAYALGVTFIDMINSGKKKDADYLKGGKI